MYSFKEQDVGKYKKNQSNYKEKKSFDFFS